MPRTTSASPPPGRPPFGQVDPWQLGQAGTHPSSTLGACSTLSSQQPFRQVVRWWLGHARTDPSSSLSCKRRAHAPLIARPGMYHHPWWPSHLTPPTRRVGVRPCSDTFSWPSIPPPSWQPLQQWVEPCVSTLFLSLGRPPVPPRATTALGRPPAPRLSRHWPESVRPNERDPLEVLVHPAVAGVVDGTASDCLPT